MHSSQVILVIPTCLAKKFWQLKKMSEYVDSNKTLWVESGSELEESMETRNAVCWLDPTRTNCGWAGKTSSYITLDGDATAENKIAGFKLPAAIAYTQLSGRQSSVAFLASLCQPSCEFLSKPRFIRRWMCTNASQTIFQWEKLLDCWIRHEKEVCQKKKPDFNEASFLWLPPTQLHRNKHCKVDTQPPVPRHWWAALGCIKHSDTEQQHQWTCKVTANIHRAKHWSHVLLRQPELGFPFWHWSNTLEKFCC